MNQMLASPSPHVHGKNSTRRIMADVLIAMMPAVLVSFYFAGIEAIQVFVLSVAGCVFTEFFIQRAISKSPVTIGDLSAAVTGVLLALNLPASSPWWMVLLGCLVAIGMGKMTFGGLGNNLFNPALVARVLLLISFPVQMTNWTVEKPLFVFEGGVQGFSGATPLGLFKENLAAGLSIQEIITKFDFSHISLFLGNIGGSLGETSAVAILLGFAYLLARKVITYHIPVTIFATVLIFSGILYLMDSTQFVDPLFHLFSGGLMLGAVFMATDYVTSPMSVTGMIIYSVGIGLLTVIIRVWGAYPEGVSFAILLMNACVPLLNQYFVPRHYGETKRHG
ncbi:MAG: Na+-transporting NADH:ubiquinone oxidoreductase subunit D [Bacteroidetes bacterium]|nr:MAG: Na+-transporting NADH:ubiquinone oxidoreductase subunit D [Bacteroidota bacterium]